MDYFDFFAIFRDVSRFFNEFSRLFLTAILFLVLLNCSHIGHRANVKKGVNLSLMVAPSRETYKPPETAWYQAQYGGKEITEKGRTDTQVSWGYAWQFRNSRKLMVQANFAMPLTPDIIFHQPGYIIRPLTMIHLMPQDSELL